MIFWERVDDFAGLVQAFCGDDDLSARRIRRSLESHETGQMQTQICCDLIRLTLDSLMRVHVIAKRTSLLGSYDDYLQRCGIA